MDFRTCPACKASVLEDDVADCPFCGASMKTGQPSRAAQPDSSRSTPSAATPPAATKGPASGKPPASKPTPGTKSSTAGKPASKGKADSGDPFDVDTSAARKATPVRPRPSKGAMIRVTCPMCERPGFISEAEVGKEVKCCNPDCLVPVYVANPPREKVPEPEPEPTGGGKYFLWGGIGLVAIAIAVAAMFVMNKRPEPRGSQMPDSPVTDNKQPDTPPPDSPTGPVQPAGPVPLTTQEIIARSLSEMQKLAEYVDNPRERAYAARLLAEAQVLQGNAAKGEAALADLPVSSKYMAIGPRTLQAWKLIDAGDVNGAKGPLDAAWEVKDSLPKRGREALDLAVNLAAALVASGRVDDAKTLANAQADVEDGEMVALWRASVDGVDYRFDQVAGRTSLHELRHPQWAAIAQVLTAHGKPGEASNWALAAPDEVSRDASSGVIAAQTAARQGQGPELAAIIDPLASKLSPAGQARVWAAVGQGLLEKGNNANAAAAAKRALELLTSRSVGTPVVVPDMLAMYQLSDQGDRGLVDPLPGWSAALAGYDVFMLQRRLGDDAAANSSLQLMLDQLRSAAPSAAATGALVRELDASASAVRERLKTALKVDDSVIVSRFSKYQTQVRAWDARALERRDLEVRLLSRAALAGDAAAVWELIQSAETTSDAAMKQAFYDSRLPGLLSELATARRDTTTVEQIRTALKTRPVSVSSTDRLRARLPQLVDPKNWKPLIVELTTYYERPANDRGLVDAALLSTLAAVMESDPKSALTLASQLPDTLLREDALWQVGGRASVRLQARVILDDFNPRSFPKAAALSLYRGSIGGASRLK
ncbi:MAG: hypothetical protein ACK5Q5_02690 [Planctomycetaceae bacterium]